MELNTIETYLLGAFIFCLLVQLYFSLFVHLRLFSFKIDQIQENTLRPVSIIICARNEMANLEKNLPEFLAQDYPAFELIVVNDRSWDGTADLLEDFQKKYDKLKVVTITDGEKFIAGKKFAVTMGIKAASNEWLVFTDADCTPASSNWLKGMQQPINEDTEIILGYSPYLKRRSLLNCIIRLETFFTAVNYLSFALKGMPYMAVGRNMAYKKSLFFKNKGFAAHMHIPSGDDDLFVNANATNRNTEIRIHRDTHVWTEPKTSFIAYLRQKKRHYGAGKLYKTKDRIILSIQFIFQFLFYVFGIALLGFSNTLYLALGIFGFSILYRSLIYTRLLNRLNYGELKWWFPILELIHFLFLTINGIVSIFVKKVQWK
ncbi:glycosyltransferase [Pedobacter insulae]|uniref:Glycosyltransferase, catalytic subunit of cellulose synthase and poly-beta-1,6-N-acetylglucosamine synthase n=1 Tax=Pedobacter insulae TaxID=414048 RepID=A0A1I2UGB5_9SPHI|nr:glycosyltransferase [Pedobacter insulae]SFG75419.1 Glycosyltransferase, catalytic subunit of cellulose synthase and poly-beta-1,6-N-acetylglucosamine synthase [Pedobacter insulae]